MTHLVSLISDHLLPNYLFIKEMEGKYDDLLFVTTEKMHIADIGARLEKALGVEKGSIRRIIVSEEDLNKTVGKLESIPFADDERFIVNLTCGTKIMSIGVYNFFSRFESSFYYIPIGKNKIENVGTSEDIPLNYRVNLHEYLTLYGLRYTNDITDKKLVESEGAKFEVDIYNRLKNELKLQNDFIFRGVKLFREDSEKMNDNEIDVMWAMDNQIYVGECKVSLSRPMTTVPEYLDQIMYKLAAISKDFGLRVNPYIFTKHYFTRGAFNEKRMSAIQKRMKILGIKGLLGCKELNKSKLKI
ncbi:MAG: DUF1887 family protein [Dysgonamonadaceae bacterium]|jgi:hypothetical protein|nr:DUF1887 family protein [Dysgonamonadaceae bacterium]